jgi:hypothetical protein
VGPSGPALDLFMRGPRKCHAGTFRDQDRSVSYCL